MGALRLNSCHRRVRFGTNMGSVHASGGQRPMVIPHLQQFGLFFSWQDLSLVWGSLIGRGWLAG